MNDFLKHLCWDSRKSQAVMFWMLVVSLALNLIVAAGNWRLYSRMERVESILGSRATPQLQQKP
jgi:uncharacterized membrane protein